jgi:hypothetical protein
MQWVYKNAAALRIVQQRRLSSGTKTEQTAINTGTMAV